MLLNQTVTVTLADGTAVRYVVEEEWHDGSLLIRPATERRRGRASLDANALDALADELRRIEAEPDAGADDEE